MLLVNHVDIGVYRDSASPMVVIKIYPYWVMAEFMRQRTQDTTKVHHTCLESANWPQQTYLTVVFPPRRLRGVHGGLRARIK